MRRLLRDWVHLIRPAVVLLAAMALFLVVRSAVIPKAFGQYGHYRPGALDTIRQRPVAYAGQGTCVLCHDDEAKVRAAGKHAHVACEACHGPLAKHADDPAANVPKLPDVANLCRRCHEKDAAKPKNFPAGGHRRAFQRHALQRLPPAAQPAPLREEPKHGYQPARSLQDRRQAAGAGLRGRHPGADHRRRARPAKPTGWPTTGGA